MTGGGRQERTAGRARRGQAAERLARLEELEVTVEKLVTGGDANPAEVLTAVQKADIAFRMMMQIRNKMVQAYQEVQNIRV